MRSDRRRTYLGAVLLALTVAATGCGSDDGKGAAPSSVTKITLAFVGSTAGGSDALDAVKLAVKQANAANPAVQIAVQDYDTGEDDAKPVKDAATYTADQSVIGVVGPDSSGTTRNVLPVYEKAGLVMVSPSSTNAKLPDVVVGGKSFHRVLPDDDVQGNSLRDFVVKRLGAKHVAYVHDGSFYGEGLAEGARDLLAAAGVQSVLTASVDPEATDYSDVVHRIVDGHADLVYYGGSTTDAGRLRKQLVQAGSKSEFLSGDGALSQDFVDAAGTAAVGSYIACGCNMVTSSAPGPAGTFAKAFVAEFQHEPTAYAAESYDAANLLIAGVRAGNTTRAKLLDYVNSGITFDGVTKKIQFDGRGNVKSSSVYLFDVRDSKLHLLGSTSDLLQ